ncbi:MAG: V-type ATP synthase subunit F [Candidatus Micrarchaeota archaeon]
MVEIAVVGPAESILGFKLAGVKAFPCSSDDANDAVMKLLSDSSIGLLIVPNDVAKNLTVKTMNLIESISQPVVVFIPGKDGVTEKSSDLGLLVKRAIGVELKK